MEDSSLSVDLVEPFDQVPGTQVRLHTFLEVRVLAVVSVSV